MTHEESVAEANRLLREAGWHPHPDWSGDYVRANLVGGIQPDKQGCHFKDYTKIMPGHPLHGPDTPDEPHEAAAWLVARFAVAPAPEASETPAHEAHGETGETAGEEPVSDLREQGSDGGGATAADSASLRGGPPDRDVIQADYGAASSVVPAILGELDFLQGDEPFKPTTPLSDEEYERVFGQPRSEVIEAQQLGLGQCPNCAMWGKHADGCYLAEPELGQELNEEHPEEYGSQFIFGDNLDQKRTAAIGLVMRHARSLMPFWTTDHDTALKELRNFAMGVSEGRWPDDPARREDLAALEATLGRIGAIVAARDAKVEFLESASREEVEAFDPEADWPA